MDLSLAQAQDILNDSQVLYKSEQLESQISRIAQELERDFTGSLPLFLTVMNGGLFFTARLLHHIKSPLLVDYIHASRYGDLTQGSSHIAWYRQPSPELVKGRDIYIVDDILDEGITLSEIISKCKKMGAINIFYTVLFNKLIDKEKIISPVYHALNVPNKFVFGFGLDYKGFGRALADLHMIN